MVTPVCGKTLIARSGRVMAFRAWRGRDLGSVGRGKEGGQGGVNRGVLCLFEGKFF